MNIYHIRPHLYKKGSSDNLLHRALSLMNKERERGRGRNERENAEKRGMKNFDRFKELQREKGVDPVAEDAFPIAHQ